MEELLDTAEIAAVEEELTESIRLIDRLLIVNRTAPSLETLRTVARAGKKDDLMLKEGLLLY